MATETSWSHFHLNAKMALPFENLFIFHNFYPQKKTEILQGSLIAALAPCKIALAKASLYLAVAAKSVSEMEACSLHLQYPKWS